MRQPGRQREPRRFCRNVRLSPSQDVGALVTMVTDWGCAGHGQTDVKGELEQLAVTLSTAW